MLDSQLKIISNPGGNAPEYGADGKVGLIKQVDVAGDFLPPAPPKPKSGEAPVTPAIAAAMPAPETVFIHPHGIWADEEENVYVAQWNSKNTYPVKLERVKI